LGSLASDGLENFFSGQHYVNYGGLSLNRPVQASFQDLSGRFFDSSSALLHTYLKDGARNILDWLKSWHLGQQGVNFAVNSSKD